MRIKALKIALRERKISVYELIKECKNNAHKFKDNNIFTEEYFSEALENAKHYQALLDSGNAPLLCGIPVAIKDNIAYKNRILSCGSAMLSDFVSPYSATAVERLDSAGAIILGKTNMDEFGMGSHSQNSFFGGVKNPINSEFSPGGSSGGSAAAVKSGAVAAALGSDTGGSVRLPAAYCGVCGLRPTYGAVSRYGLVAFSSSLDTIGTLGNTPRDCYEVFSAISGVDELDFTSVNCKDSPIVSGMKICSLVEFFAKETANDVYLAITKFLDSRKDLFEEIVEQELPEAQFVVSAYYVLSSAEAASNLARFDGIKYGNIPNSNLDFSSLVCSNRTKDFATEVKKRILLGNYLLSEESYDEYYRKALSLRRFLTEKIEKLLNIYDAIILPTSLIPVPKLSDIESISKNFNNDKCNAISSLCGLPSLSFPVGEDRNGMPVSLSIIGRKFNEEYITLLAEKMIGVEERYV